MLVIQRASENYFEFQDPGEGHSSWEQLTQPSFRSRFYGLHVSVTGIGDSFVVGFMNSQACYEQMKQIDLESETAAKKNPRQWLETDENLKEKHSPW